MRKLFIIITVCLVLGCFVILEALATKKYSASPIWFEKAGDIAKSQPVDYMFIGSSIIAAAVDPDVFSNEIYLRTGRKPNVLNLGRGYTTIAEYYLGLRSLFERYPDSFNGCVVFIDAAEGMPVQDSWEDPWFRTERANYIQTYLFYKDIKRAWKSPFDVKTKLSLTSMWMTKSIYLLSNQKKIRAGLLSLGASAIEKACRLDGDEGHSEASSKGQIAAAAGVKLDDHSIARIRQAAYQFSKDIIMNQKIVKDWNQTILFDLSQLIQLHGGKLVLLDIPLSSVFRKAYFTDIQNKNRRSLEANLKEWDVPMIDTEIQLTDQDFPDLWHLRKSKMKEFTTNLVLAYMRPADN